MSRNYNSKDCKNSEHSINPGFTEKLRVLHKMFFVISRFFQRKTKDYPLMIITTTTNIMRKSLKDFVSSTFVNCQGVRCTYH